MSCTFVDAEKAVNETPANVVVVAHGEAKMENISGQLQQALVPGGLEALQMLALRAKAGKETTASAETFVKMPGGEAWQRIALGVLPLAAPSRSCAPGHPHSVTDLVKSLSGSDNVSIFLVLKNPEVETLATCLAIPRAFSLCSFKSKPATERSVQIFTGVGESVLTNQSLDRTVRHAELAGLAAGIQEAAKLVDTPPNILNVNSYVKRALEWAGSLPGVTTKVIQGEELRAMGMGGLFGVGAASVEPSALVILSHNASADKKSLCLVGKGIVYDTGGLSIKTKTGMPGMKADMGGSAGCLGAFYSLVQAGGLDIPLHCLLCIAENSVSAPATRPDDVQTFYSGKTVEINNTDAEGRLVLADGLAYANRHLNPGYMIDMATLTGAQSSATGLKHAAIFTNSEALESLAIRAGKLSGDLTHPLPYAPEFFRGEFKSAVADMKNSQKDRNNCGSAAPATFLSNHIEDYIERGAPWLHIDMAYPVVNGERGTGYGVALLHLIALGISKI